ncbi:MAG TPA: hypothetical protein PKE26_02935 [Kiritimatiellia bacterium]|nr:hypothetical protein [Kiritimatiellia bacterium]HMO98044.1 hypothetical protein [Kiritimatiellia bacterium]HMP97402.1 hypothetical protein [Kiritimatiellia bacterium]
MVNTLHRMFFRSAKALLLLMAMLGSDAWAGDGRIKLGALDFPVVINTSGSYVLTDSITISNVPPGGRLIFVNASHVTIDLNGHYLRWNGASDLVMGIEQDINHRGLRVRNGVIDGFGVGIKASQAARVEDILFLRVFSALWLGPGAMVRHIQIDGARPMQYPVVWAGDGSRVDGVQINNTATTNSPLNLVQFGAASRVSNIQIHDLASADPSQAIAFQAGSGSMINDLHIRGVQHAGSSFTTVLLRESILLDSAVETIATTAGSLRGVEMRNSLAARLQVSGLSAGTFSWLGYDVAQTWLADSRFTSTSATGRSVNAASSRVARNSIDGGFVDVSASVLRDNHIQTALLYGILHGNPGANLAIRNHVSGSSGAMIFDPSSASHHARIEAFPGDNFIFTNNPFANIQH